MTSRLNQTTKASIAVGMALLMGAAMAGESGECLAPSSTAVSAQPATSTVIASDGVCLRSFVWKPTRTPARAIVVITHGIRDYALRYSDFARQLTDEGYVVYAQDLRGHAHSGGPRQRFDSLTQLVGDTQLVVEQARGSHPNIPLFVLGHSLGGLITTEYALAHGDNIRGVVLTGAALQRPKSVNDISIVAARIVGAVAPGLEIVKVDDSEFSRDPAVMAALASDPLVSHAKLPAATAVASINGMADVQARMGELRMPLLVLYGTADKVNPTEGSDLLMKGAGSSDKTLKTYPGVYHDMLHEPERAQIAADIIAWLNARS